jgi:two-component system cell cycle sensor histidine kinase/response regulator CckA
MTAPGDPVLGVETDPGEILEALDTPAALCALDGLVVRANGAWRAVAGQSPHALARCEGLFPAFRAARRAGRGRGLARLGGLERLTEIARVGEDRFLVRLPSAPAVSPPADGTDAARPPGLDALAGLAPFGAALVDGPDPFAGPILAANAAFWALAGGGPSPGVGLATLIAEPVRAEVADAFAEGRAGPFDVVLAAAPDRAAQLHLIAGEGRVAAYLLDVTAQAMLRRQLNQRHKMEAIGQLAGGVAHDFNNVLTGLGLRVEDLLRRHPLGDPDYDTLGEIHEGVDRATALVAQLLTYSRKAAVRPEVLDLAGVLIDLEAWLRRLLGDAARLETVLAPDIPRIRVDRGQLEMAVMNLVVNARDALKGRGGGLIRLTAGRVDPARAAALGLAVPAAGDLALIEVADDGPGISEAVIDRIFEPFFTTKPMGEGTGLGLATVQGAVAQSGGWIIAASPPGQGAVFRIFLPVHAPRLVLPPPPPPARPPPRDLAGVGRILFVEDDGRVRDIAARLLRGQGYEVMEAADGEAALALARANAGRIDLLISDVSMPGMDGPELLRAARPHLGAAPVMFISGYAQSEIEDLLAGEPGVFFLPKPLRFQSLAEQVKARLSGA